MGVHSRLAGREGGTRLQDADIGGMVAGAVDNPGGRDEHLADLSSGKMSIGTGIEAPGLRNDRNLAAQRSDS